MSRHAILFPLQPGSRTPEEFREAVRKVMEERSEADWEFLKAHPLDLCPDDEPTTDDRTAEIRESGI